MFLFGKILADSQRQKQINWITKNENWRRDSMRTDHLWLAISCFVKGIVWLHSRSSLSEYVVSYGIQRWRRFILLSFFFGLKTCRTSVFCGLSLLLSLLRNPRVFFISPRLKISICAMRVLFDLPGESTPSNYLCKLRCQLSRRSDVLS